MTAASVLEYAAACLLGPPFALGWVVFWVLVPERLAAAAKMAYRAARLLFLGIGWAVVIARLIL